MRISASKEEKIKESALHLLFESSPRAMFTAAIAQTLARDEEYMKKLLLDLEARKLVVSVKKNSDGKGYRRRMRWLLDPKTYETYKGLSAQRL